MTATIINLIILVPMVLYGLYMIGRLSGGDSFARNK